MDINYADEAKIDAVQVHFQFSIVYIAHTLRAYTSPYSIYNSAGNQLKMRFCCILQHSDEFGKINDVSRPVYYKSNIQMRKHLGQRNERQRAVYQTFSNLCFVFN